MMQGPVKRQAARRQEIVSPDPRREVSPRLMLRAKKTLTTAQLGVIEENLAEAVRGDGLIVIGPEFDLAQLIDGQWIPIFGDPDESEVQEDDDGPWPEDVDEQEEQAVELQDDEQADPQAKPPASGTASRDASGGGPGPAPGGRLQVDPLPGG